MFVRGRLSPFGEKTMDGYEYLGLEDRECIMEGMR